MNDNIDPSKYGPELECPICRELFFHPVSMNCGHTFCKECLLPALKQKPMCPLCRTPIFIQEKTLNENITLRTLIENTYKEINHQRELKQRTIQANEISLENTNNSKKTDADEARKFENFISLRYTNSINQYLFPDTILRLKLQFEGSLELLSYICPNKTFVCLPSRLDTNNINYPFNSFSVECLEFVRADNSILEARVRIVDRIKIEKFTEFPIENADFRRSFHLPENSKFYVCNGTYLDDDHGTIDQSKKQTLIELISFIGEFFRRILEDINARSQTTVYKLVWKIGEQNMPVLFSQDMTQFTNLKTIEKFSFLAAGLLKLRPADKQRLFETNNVLERLVMLRSFIEKFNQHVDPLMIIDLDVPSQKLFTPLYSILIVLGIFLYLFLIKK
jgi:hypothetical protein